PACCMNLKCFRRLLGWKVSGCCLAIWVYGFERALATDWPQLQHDAARTGRNPDEVTPPYRARWLWFGSSGTLPNRLARPSPAAWTNDLTSGVGKSYPMPRNVAFTLSGMMQPIVYRGLVIVASQEGKVFAIAEDDGATVWEADLPGGSISTGAAAEGVVVF